jgi:hypothetical protein
MNRAVFLVIRIEIRALIRNTKRIAAPTTGSVWAVTAGKTRPARFMDRFVALPSVKNSAVDVATHPIARMPKRSKTEGRTRSVTRENHLTFSLLVMKAILRASD